MSLVRLTKKSPILLFSVFLSLLSIFSPLIPTASAESSPDNTLRAEVIIATKDPGDGTAYGKIPVSLYYKPSDDLTGYKNIAVKKTNTTVYIKAEDGGLKTSNNRKVWVDFTDKNINSDNDLAVCLGDSTTNKVTIDKILSNSLCVSATKVSNPASYSRSASLLITDTITAKKYVTTTTETPSTGTINITVSVKDAPIDKPSLDVSLYKTIISNGGSLTDRQKGAATPKDILLIAKFSNQNISPMYAACIDGYPDAIRSGDVGCSEGKNFGTGETRLALTITLTKEQYAKYTSSIGTTDKVSTCSPDIGGLGWILCPVTKALASAVDGAYGQIEKLLVFNNPKALFNQDNATYKTWQVIRNIANVLFVVVFLIIIYSQMTGFGITNYGVKKMLPRLIVAAILVNVSFFICQVAVDATNILGSGLKDFLENIVTQGSNNATTSGFVSATSTVLALVSGVAGVGIAVWSLLPLLGVCLLAAAAAVLVVLLILVARQAVIIVLIVIAPIAFVAYLLPNTTKLFDKWKNMFIGLLIIYPATAAVLGGSKLIAEVLNSAFSDSTPEWSLLTAIIVATANIIPLLVVPLLLKKSLDAVPMLGKFASDLSNRANKNVGKQFGEAYKNTDFSRNRALKKKLRGDIRDESYAEKISKGEYGGAQSLSNRIRKGMGMEPSALQNKLVKTGERARLAREDAELKEESRVFEAEMVNIKANKKTSDGKSYASTDEYLRDMAKSTSGNSTSKRGAAMDILAKTGRDGELRDMQGNADFEQELLYNSIRSNAGALANKAPDLIKGAGPAFDNISAEQYSNYSAATAAAHIKYLEELHTNATAKGASQNDKDKFNTAFSSFQASVNTIQSDTTLQAKFDGTGGLQVLKELTPAGGSTPTAFQSYMSGSSVIASIDKDNGKIR